MKKIAVILCGSGFKDGSEIREAVGVLWALSQHPVEVQCFAPEALQADVVNCLTGDPVKGESRSMLVEAARIARGKIEALSSLDARDFAGLVIPGGLGVAKNLCDFATRGANATVRPELLKALRDFHSTRKPIGAVCIAPTLLALAFAGEDLELTLGDACDASREIEKLGHRHIVKAANDCHVDANHRVVTTPAYMVDGAPLHEIFDGIQKLVQEVIKMTEVTDGRQAAAER